MELSDEKTPKSLCTKENKCLCRACRCGCGHQQTAPAAPKQCSWLRSPQFPALPCVGLGEGGWGCVLFWFLKQWLPEQKADLCSRQSWGPPRARGCSPIWCHTITNKNNNEESCTHFARYGVLKVTQYEAIIPKWQFYLKITFKLKWAFQGLLLKSDMGCSGAHCHFVSCHMLPPAKWAQFAFTLYPDS